VDAKIKYRNTTHGAQYLYVYIRKVLRVENLSLM